MNQKKALLLLAALAGAVVVFAGNDDETSGSSIPLPDGSAPSGPGSGSGSAATGSGTSKLVSGDIFIFDYDSVWEYWYDKNQKWWTRKKGNTVWLDMKASLSQSNYELAVSRLTSHLAKKNIYI